MIFEQTVSNQASPVISSIKRFSIWREYLIFDKSKFITPH